MRYIRLIVGMLVTTGLSSGPVLASSPAAKTLITGAKAALPYSYAGYRVVETTRTGESRVVNEAGDVDARMVYASTIKPFYLAAANALLHERRGASFSYFTTPLLTKYLGTKTLQEIAAPLITEQPTGGASNDALVNLRELIARELGGAALPTAQRTRMANDWIQAWLTRTMPTMGETTVLISSTKARHVSEQEATEEKRTVQDATPGFFSTLSAIEDGYAFLLDPHNSAVTLLSKAEIDDVQHDMAFPTKQIPQIEISGALDGLLSLTYQGSKYGYWEYWYNGRYQDPAASPDNIRMAQRAGWTGTPNSRSANIANIVRIVRNDHVYTVAYFMAVPFELPGTMDEQQYSAVNIIPVIGRSFTEMIPAIVSRDTHTNWKP